MTVVPKPGTAARRRRRTNRTLHKTTVHLEDSLLQAMKQAIEEGAAPNASAFVEDAIRMKLREVRRERLYAAYAEAAQDPGFLAEMESTTRAFEGTVDDGLTGERA